MAKELEAFRVYASTPSSVENLPYASLKNEIHIVVPFARDYTSNGSPNNGTFLANFDTANFTADKIKAIRKNVRTTSLKFFLSIGGRDPRFPFAVTSGQASSWATTATTSLKQIVTTYGFDGIDVYYENINADAKAQFAETINDVIWNLKSDGTIKEASMTVPAPLSNLYFELFDKNTAVFNYVVYQTHTETSRISTFKQLADVFDRIPAFPKEKVFAGHSDVRPSDWTNVSLPTFLGAVPRLLNDKKLLGISKWIVTDYNPEA